MRSCCDEREHFFNNHNFNIMTTTDNKTTNLSERVKDILFIKGYDKVFNWDDFNYYIRMTAKAIHRAEAIANLFIEESNEISDYAEYEF